MDNQSDSQVSEIEELYSKGESQRAKEKLYETLQRDPGHFKGNLLLGKILVTEEQGQHAIMFLQKALQQKEDDAEVHAHMGMAFYQMGKHEACIKSLRRSLELDPNRYETQVQLGQVMAQFVPPWHFGMLSDLERNEAYDKLLSEFITPESVVLDIGTGSGLLAMMAARHGAKHIYACEQSHFVADVAKEIISQNGFSDRITLFPNKSSDIQPHHLSEVPNLIIGEIFDSAMVGEGAIPSFRDAYKRLAGPECRVIPNKAEIKGMLIESFGQKSINPLGDISGFDLSAFNQFRAPTDYASIRLPNYSHRFLSNEQVFLQYDFENLHEPRNDNEPFKIDTSILVSHSGMAHGIVLWFDLSMENRMMLSNEPSRLDNHWGQAVCFFREKIEVKPGDQILTTLCHTDMRIWFESSQLVANS